MKLLKNNLQCNKAPKTKMSLIKTQKPVLILQMKISAGSMALLRFMKDAKKTRTLFFTTMAAESFKKMNKYTISTVSEQTNTSFLTMASLSPIIDMIPMNFTSTLIWKKSKQI